MNRRTFLIPSRAEPRLEWQMATSWSKDLDLVMNAINFFQQRVAAITDGKFVIKMLEDSQKVPPFAVLDAVGNNTVSIGHTSMYYYVNRVPAFAFAATVPFGLTAYQQLSWYYQGGGLELLEPLFAAVKVVGIPCGSPGVQMGGWFREELNRSSDFRGLKMRIPGLGGQVLSRLGAKVVLLSADQIYGALERGEVDAAEWQNPYDDEKLGLHRVAKFYYYPGWWEPGLSNYMIVNRQAWQNLSRTYQEILRATAAEAGMKMLADYNSNNAAALDRLVAGGTQIRAFSTEFLQSAYQGTIAVLEEQAQRDREFRRIYGPWRKFRAQIYQWNRVNELSFEKFTFNDSRL
ncbi:MAG: TRAP transporter substrate-binding protein DctP [Oscillatoriales cyanobacterium SM2_2_1]|nr:TRAP transporter substrate-binding protein DctP [Oscillatoriales cyanobacterium SM2_2_1]